MRKYKKNYDKITKEEKKEIDKILEKFSMNYKEKKIEQLTQEEIKNLETKEEENKEVFDQKILNILKEYWDEKGDMGEISPCEYKRYDEFAKEYKISDVILLHLIKKTENYEKKKIVIKDLLNNEKIENATIIAVPSIPNEVAIIEETEEEVFIYINKY